MWYYCIVCVLVVALCQGMSADFCRSFFTSWTTHLTQPTTSPFKPPSHTLHKDQILGLLRLFLLYRANILIILPAVACSACRSTYLVSVPPPLKTPIILDSSSPADSPSSFFLHLHMFRKPCKFLNAHLKPSSSRQDFFPLPPSID